MERVGWEKVRTELEVIPAQIRLVNIYQETVRCQKCYEETGYARFVRAAVPSPLIPHSPASPTTVAYVMYHVEGRNNPSTGDRSASFSNLK